MTTRATLIDAFATHCARNRADTADIVRMINDIIPGAVDPRLVDVEGVDYLDGLTSAEIARVLAADCSRLAHMWSGTADKSHARDDHKYAARAHSNAAMAHRMALEVDPVRQHGSHAEHHEKIAAEHAKIVLL